MAEYFRTYSRKAGAYVGVRYLSFQEAADACGYPGGDLVAMPERREALHRDVVEAVIEYADSLIAIRDKPHTPKLFERSHYARVALDIAILKTKGPS